MQTTTDLQFETPQDLSEKTNNSQSSELLKIETIENSPFSIVSDLRGVEPVYFGAIAENRVTEYFDTKEECEENLKEITWNRIIQVVYVMVTKYKELLNLNLND